MSELKNYLMKGKLALTTPAHIFAASPAICKDVVERLKVQCIETNEYKAVPTQVSPSPCTLPPAVHCTTVHDITGNNFPHQCPIDSQPLAFCLPLQELDILIDSSTKVPAILNTSSQIIVIQHDIVQSLGIPINYH